MLVPARPGSILGTEVDKPSDRYRRIVDFIRQYSAGDCFIALPAMNLEGDVTFQTFGRDKAREEQFRQALSSLDDLRAEISTGNVADPQCLALSFARNVEALPRLLPDDRSGRGRHCKRNQAVGLSAQRR